MMLHFPTKAIDAACAHAMALYPAESCGFIVDGEYVVAENVATDPLTEFSISPEAQLAAEEIGPIQAIVHSHPDGPIYPTAKDMQGQIDSAVPWLVVPTNGEICGEIFEWGGDVPVPDLIGRTFRHGITDCYSLIRDYYKIELGITLIEGPRDDNWWDNGENLYMENFTKAGFRIIQPGEIKKHDVFLASIKADVPNHGGVYIGDNLILHHLPSRLSRREPVGIWMSTISVWLRHEALDA